LAVSALAFLGMSAHWSREFIRVDSCLDAGHVYNYAEEVCDTEALTLPIIRYRERHPYIVYGGVTITALGLVAAVVSATLNARSRKDVG
jgi:hypothetical protein